MAGCEFDSLSFGSSAIQIVGVKNSSFRTGADQLGIVLDIDVRWAGQPGAQRAVLLSNDPTDGGVMRPGTMRNTSYGSDCRYHAEAAAIQEVDD